MKFFYKKLFLAIVVNVITYHNLVAITDALKVKVFNDITSDETVVRFLPTATNGFDGNYDAYKMLSTNPSSVSVFTEIDSQTLLSINALPPLVNTVDVDLFICIKKAGVYTLQSLEIGAFLNEVKIVLEDKETGTQYNFRNGVSINLELIENTINSPSRFVLHFIPQGGISTGVISDSLITTQLLKFSLMDNNLALNFENQSQANFSVFVFNSLGQDIYSFSNNQLSNFSENIVLTSSGNYYVNSFIDDVFNSIKVVYIK